MYIDGFILSSTDDLDVDKNNILDIPYFVEEVEDYACSHLTNVQEINLPQNLIKIGDEVFIGCKNLKSIRIPSSVKSIGIYVFNGCTNLEFVDMNDFKVLEKWYFGDECNPKCRVKFNNKIYLVEDIYNYDINIDLNKER